jgi:hypothetical protein
MDTPVSYVVWGSMFLFPVLYFPDGELLSRRWRYLVWAIVADFAVLLAAGLFYAGLESPMFRGFRNPLANPVGTRIWESANLLFFPIYGLAPLSLVIRFRRARGVERQQVKWPLFSALIIFIAVGLYFVGGVLYGNTQDNPVARVGLVFEQISVMSFPITVGMAILRYRLYDIDIIIRKTLQYTLVSGILAVIYFGVVTQLEALLRTASGQGSPLAVVISTLAIAALFNPLRKRVQAFIDRRFYRRRYDTERVLAAFSASLRDEVDLDELRDSILEVVDETMQPARVSLWLRDVEER